MLSCNEYKLCTAVDTPYTQYLTSMASKTHTGNALGLGGPNRIHQPGGCYPCGARLRITHRDPGSGHIIFVLAVLLLVCGICGMWRAFQAFGFFGGLEH